MKGLLGVWAVMFSVMYLITVFTEVQTEIHPSLLILLVVTVGALGIIEAIEKISITKIVREDMKDEHEHTS